MIIIPSEPVGYGTGNMIVVICPICHNKAWATVGKKSTQTVCCSAMMDAPKKPVEPKLTPILITPTSKKPKPNKDKKRKDQGRRGR